MIDNMQRSRKLSLSHSGFNIPELYAELESALLTRNLERSVCLTAELACTQGGQTKAVISFLIDTYCARCVNSGRAQLNLLRSSLAHLGDGTSKSPDNKARHDIVFRRGLCTLTLLVACAGDRPNEVASAFSRVPNYHERLPSLESALCALRGSTTGRDAHKMSSIIKALQDEAWFLSTPRLRNRSRDANHVQEMPDIERLCAYARKDAVWDLWRLACELGKSVGVSEYVDNCLHAFAWGYTAPTAKARVHILWYAFLVIVKGAPRTGLHPIDQDTFERALLCIDDVFEDVLCKRPREGPTVEARALDNRLSYLTTITRHDPSKALAVEKDREGARGNNPLDTKSVDLVRGPRETQTVTPV